MSSKIPTARVRKKLHSGGVKLKIGDLGSQEFKGFDTIRNEENAKKSILKIYILLKSPSCLQKLKIFTFQEGNLNAIYSIINFLLNIYLIFKN